MALDLKNHEISDYSWLDRVGDYFNIGTKWVTIPNLENASVFAKNSKGEQGTIQIAAGIEAEITNDFGSDVDNVSNVLVKVAGSQAEAGYFVDPADLSQAMIPKELVNSLESSLDLNRFQVACDQIADRASKFDDMLTLSKATEPLTILTELPDAQVDIHSENSRESPPDGLQTLEAPKADRHASDFGADLVSARRLRSRDLQRATDAEDEVHTERHNKLIDWLKGKHPDGKVTKSVAEGAIPIETKGDAQPVIIPAKEVTNAPQTITGLPLEPARAEATDVGDDLQFGLQASEPQTEKAAELTDPISIDQPTPDSPSVATEFNLSATENVPAAQTRIREMVGQGSEMPETPAIANTETAPANSLPIHEEAATPEANADVVVGMAEQPTLRQDFDTSDGGVLGRFFKRMIPRGNASTREFGEVEKLAEQRGETKE